MQGLRFLRIFKFALMEFGFQKSHVSLLCESLLGDRGHQGTGYIQCKVYSVNLGAIDYLRIVTKSGDAGTKRIQLLEVKVERSKQLVTLK